MPVSSVVIGAFVTAGAALLPDVDHHNGTIAHSGGLFTRGVAAAAGAASGGHRHGMHSILAVLGFTVGTILVGRWQATVPLLGVIPAGSALIFLALVVFATKALKLGRGGILKLWVGSAVVVLAVLVFAPEQLGWLPLSVMVGVIVHLAGDMITTGGVPLMWPWIPKPPKFWSASPFLNVLWKKNGYVSVPILGNTGSVREWCLFAVLSVYTVYGLAATTGLVAVSA